MGLQDKTFLLLGASDQNNGAHAMLWSAVCDIRARFPGAQIICLSFNGRATEGFPVQDPLCKDLMYNLNDALFCQGGIWRVLGALKEVLQRQKRSRAAHERILQICQTADYALNMSGYAFSSEWGFVASLAYLLQIRMLKKYQIPVVLAPQSFGPLRFRGIASYSIDLYAKRVLPYPTAIFAREQPGFHLLTTRYHLSNVRLSPDMVLTSRIDFSQYDCGETLPEILPGAVALIPNANFERFVGAENTLRIYTGVVRILLNAGRTVYIMRNDEMDAELCGRIAGQFSNDPRIRALMWRSTCFSFSRLIKRFDYAVASRYHAIVLAYRQGVPCAAIGWTEKYCELLHLLGQQEYLICPRETMEPQTLECCLSLMEKNHRELSSQIQARMHMLQQQNQFSFGDILMENTES